MDNFPTPVQEETRHLPRAESDAGRPTGALLGREDWLEGGETIRLSRAGPQ